MITVPYIITKTNMDMEQPIKKRQIKKKRVRSKKKQEREE